MGTHTIRDIPARDILTSLHWMSTGGDGEIIASYVRFFPDGRVGGEASNGLPFWRHTHDRLAILDDIGRTILTFDRAEEVGGKLSLLSAPEYDAAGGFVLREIEPAHVRARPHRKTDLIIRRPPTGRRHLVVLRANEQSLHLDWEQDLPDDQRSWDLCVSFYGRRESYPPHDFSEFSSFQAGERKFQAIRSLLLSNPLLRDYDYFMFPDDDLQMSWSDINRAFHAMHRWGLRIAQPSLKSGGHINYSATLQDHVYRVRFTNMVEVMIPMMSRDVLRDCLGTFDLTRSSFGIDYVWSKVADVRLNHVGIIDDVAVLHTRPTASNYDIQPAYKEGDALCAQYGKSEWFQVNVRGGILQPPDQDGEG